MKIIYSNENSHIEFQADTNGITEAEEKIEDLISKSWRVSDKKEGVIAVIPEYQSDAIIFMKLFCKYIEKNEPPPEYINRFISDAFLKIINTDKLTKDVAWKALCLGKERKRPRIFDERNVAITKEVIQLMDDGKSLSDACDLLSDKHHLTPGRIEKIYLKNQESIRFGIPF